MLSEAAIAIARDGAYRAHVSPQWARVLDRLGMNVPYGRCAGAELFTEGGERVLDFQSCDAQNTGHNHPRIVAALAGELARGGPVMLRAQVPELAGELAARLCRRAGGALNRVLFCSSANEALEAAIGLARAATRRAELLSGCALRSIDALESALSTNRFAAFLVEPAQAEAGVRLPGGEYLRAAQLLCRRYGTLLALDETQTGLYRTGPFLAAHHFSLDPDLVVLGNALGGGLVPSAAVLMSDAVCDAAHGSLHHTAWGENALALRAGLATLDVLEDERLGERATALGNSLRHRLRTALSQFEMTGEIRGLGLLCGIEFTAPRQWRLRAAYEACRRVHPAFFGQVLVMRLFAGAGLLTRMCGYDPMVLKAAPPLVVTESQIDEFVDGLAGTLELIHCSRAAWAGALRLACRSLAS